MRRLLLGLGLLAALGSVGAIACFAPQQPGCAFSCAAAPHTCPTGYHCANDGLCHRDDGLGLCLTDPLDGGSDGVSDGL